MYNKFMGNSIYCSDSNLKKISANFRQANEYEKIIFGLMCLEMLYDDEIISVYHEYNALLPFDDVVICYPNSINCYQIKYTSDSNGLIKYDDILNKSELNIDISRYKTVFEKYRTYPNVYFHIYTNRSADEEFCKILSNEKFSINFINNKEQKNKWQELKNNSQIESSEDFVALLKSIQFDLKQASLDIKKQELKNKFFRLGLDENAFSKYLNALNDWWLESYTRSITKKDIENVLQINNLFIQQKFNIDYNLFIDNISFKRQLKKIIKEGHNYVSIIGPPGSGKSTFINNFVENESSQIIKYLCYSNTENSIIDVENRANIKTYVEYFIKQFQLRYNYILEENDNHRRYEYSEQNYIDSIKKISSHLETQSTNLIIMIDGIDHVIRSGVKDNFLKLLRQSCKNIIYIITAQNEDYLPNNIKNYCQNNGALLRIPLFSKNSCIRYLNKYFKENKDKASIIISNIDNIYEKSEGLPLYLRYIAEYLKNIEIADLKKNLVCITNIPNQNIQHYYESIWEQFENDSNIKKSCAFIANLNFDITKAELFNVLNISSFDGEPILSKIRHLLNIKENSIKVFHNSFKEFINNKLTPEQKNEIHNDLYQYLKTTNIFDSVTYNYIFEYAWICNDYNFLYENITSDLIEQAFIKGKNENQIKEVITFGLKASVVEKNFVEFARLSILYAELDKKYTDFHISKLDLYNVYLAKKDFTNLFNLFSKNSIVLDVNNDIAQILINLSYESLSDNMQYFCNSLVNNFIDKYIDITEKEKNHYIDRNLEQKVFELLAIYTNKYRYLYYLIEDFNKTIIYGDIVSLNPTINQFNIICEHLYRLNKYSQIKYINKIIKKCFNNFPVYEYWLVQDLRLKAKYKELNTFIFTNHIDKIKETDLIIQALKVSIDAGINNEIISKYLYRFDYNIELNPDNIRYGDGTRQLNLFRDYISICLYCSEKNKLDNLYSRFIKGCDWLAFYYEINYELFIGIYGKRDTNYFLEILEKLNNKKKFPHERIFESFDIIKKDLPNFLNILFKNINVTNDNIQTIKQKIINFFQSEIIDTHYGIGIVNVDFISIFEIIDSLIKIDKDFIPIEFFIKSLETKIYEDVLETNERTAHYLRLSALSYRARFNVLGDEYFAKGIKSSNGYHNRKDVTLFNLIETLDLINKKIDNNTFLNYFYEIAKCSNWLFTITDHKETRHIRKDVFNSAFNHDFNFGLYLLKQYQKRISDWEISDCINYLVEHYNEQELILPYVLTQSIQNDSYSENNYQKRFEARLKLFKKVSLSSNNNIKNWFYKSITKYLQCDIPLSNDRYILIEKFNNAITETGFLPLKNLYIPKDKKNNRYEPRDEKYEYNGKSYLVKDLVNIAKENIDKYIELYTYTLNNQKSFSLRQALEEELNNIINRINNISDLDKIYSFMLYNEKVLTSRIGDIFECFAYKYKDLGNKIKYIEALEKCFGSSIEYGFKYFTNVRMDILKILIENDYDKTINYLLNISLDTILVYPYQGKVFQQFIIQILLNYSKGSLIKDCIKIYDNFHNEILKEFAFLPHKEFSINYDWIKAYKIGNNNNDLLLDIIFNEWSDYSYYKRLEYTHLISDLAITYPTIVIPKLFETISDKNYTLSHLSALVINHLSINNSNLLEQYEEKIEEKIINLKHFEINFMMIDSLNYINSDRVNKLIKSLYYSNSDSFSILLSDEQPSQEFINKFMQYIPKAFTNYVKQVSKEINIQENTIYHDIEEILIADNIDYNLEINNHQNLYENYCSRGSNKFIPFEDNYGNLVYHALNMVLEQYLRDFGYGIDSHQNLHEILKIYDSRFFNKYQLPNMDYNKTFPEENNISGWINFEDVKDNVKTIKLNDIDEDEIIIIDDYKTSNDLFHEQIDSYFAYDKKEPFLSCSFENIFNITTTNIFYLNPAIQNKYKLEAFNDIPNYKNSSGIQIKQELWQSGIEDNDMSFKFLAQGTKVTIKKEFLKQILENENCKLSIVKFMKRFYNPETYKKEEKQANRIMVTIKIEL